MTAERLQILRMVQEGKLTAEEAAKLLEAMEVQPRAAAADAKYLRVRVLDRAGKGRSAELRVPMGLVRTVGKVFGLGFLRTPDGQTLDWADIERALQAGQAGRAIEVESDAGRVEIYLE